MIELVYAKELILLKVTTAKNVRFAITGFLIMDLNFKILYAMVAMISQCSVFNISDIAIITIKDVHYRCIIHNSRSEAIDLLKNFVLEDRGYI